MASTESDLIIVSLVRYADSCEPTHRHSDCPFAVERDGKLTCHEECRDVIRSLLRRGRSEPTQGAQAFDARQILLSEPSGAPDQLWHTSSLLQILVRMARSSPLRGDGSFELQRFVYGTSALGALGCRGLDSENLIRRGVGKTIKLAVAATVGKSLERSDGPESSWEHLDQWRAVFEEGPDEQSPHGGYIWAALYGSLASRLDAWIESAPIEDVLLWRPPQAQIALSETGMTDAEAEPWQWIVERFTKTYLGDWSLAALKREYSFVQGAWIPDFPTMLLAERSETSEKVAAALADRAIVSDDEIDPSTMRAFVDQAVVLLADGQRTAAAAIFEAARAIKPADMDAQNNYAFCILPDRPDQARTLLKDLLDRGAPSPPVTWCNLALAESLLEHTDTALEACKHAYEAEDGGYRVHLWQRRDDDWVVEYVSPRSWAIRFGAQIEASTGATGPWAERLKSLTLSEPQETSADPSSEETDGEDL
jgi:hypothetical protein